MGDCIPPDKRVSVMLSLSNRSINRKQTIESMHSTLQEKSTEIEELQKKLPEATAKVQNCRRPPQLKWQPLG
jgi:hypothetical protein